MGAVGVGRLSVVAVALMAALSAEATNFSLWINGRGGGGAAGNYGDFAYWGPSSVAAGVNKKAVNWDGYNRISVQEYRLRDALDCFCTGQNWCYVAAHSAGNMMIGYVLDLYGGSQRYKKTPSPRADGQCSNSDGTTQTGWNIKWVYVAGGAAGGSELADYGSWAVSEPLVSDLKTTTARALYNHNNTRGNMFFMFAGAKGSVSSALLPGEDDEAVAYHSSGGVAGSSGGSFCNSGDWFCRDVLSLGTSPTSKGRAKWANHSVKLRDDGVAYGHTANGNWGGIVGPMRAAMAQDAR